MNEKILFVYSEKRQIELPQKLLSNYQVKSVLAKSKKVVYNTVVEYKPQLIICDENIKIKYVKYILEQFKFVPICIIGYFENTKVLEKFLELNLTTISVMQTETEIVSTIENLLWFALSKEELWEEEYKLCRSDLLKDKILFFSKLFGVMVVIIVLIFFLPKIYNVLATTKPIYSEVNLNYISPSDIVVLNNKFILSDWTIRNILEYDLYTGQLVKMYVMDEQLNAVSLNNKGDFVASSVFSNKVRLFHYPDFSITISTLSLLQGKTVIAVHLDDNNNLYVLDNKSTLFHYEIKDNNIIFVSSFVITEFFPIDVYTYDNFLFLLDSKNNIYKLVDEKEKKFVSILLDKFFEPQQIKFVSFAINKDWIFFVSETSKKIVKLPSKIVNIKV